MCFGGSLGVIIFPSLVVNEGYSCRPDQHIIIMNARADHLNESLHFPQSLDHQCLIRVVAKLVYVCSYNENVF